MKYLDITTFSVMSGWWEIKGIQMSFPLTESLHFTERIPVVLVSVSTLFLGTVD